MNKRTKKIVIGTSIFLVGILIGSYVAYALSPTSTYWISSGIYPSQPDYTIWKEGGNYFSKDRNGQLDFAGTNCTWVYAQTQTALGSNGGTIFFKGGTTYYVRIGNLISNLLLTCGKKAILKLADLSNTHLIYQVGTSIENVHIDGFIFDGNGNNQLSGTSRNDLELLVFHNITNLKFTNNIVRYTRDGAGLNLCFCVNAEITGNRFQENGYIIGIGYLGSWACDHIHCGGNVFSKISNNHFHTCTDTSIASDNDEGCIFSGNTFQGYGCQFVTIWNDNTTYYKGRTSSRSIISNNYFWGDVYDSLGWGYPNNFANILISNSSYATSVPVDILIEGNHFFYDDNGIFISWGAKVNIVGNHFYYESVGIATEHISELQITSNFFTGEAVGVKINAHSSTGSDFINVNDNHFYDHSYSEFWIVVTPTTYEINDNYGYLTENHGVATMSGTSLVVSHGLGNVNEVCIPLTVLLTFESDPNADYWVDTFTSTSFTIHVDSSYSGDVFWVAEGKPT